MHIIIMWFLFQVLGIPWDIDTDGLKAYMSKFGEPEDCIVMKVSSSWLHSHVATSCNRFFDVYLLIQMTLKWKY